MSNNAAVPEVAIDDNLRSVVKDVVYEVVNDVLLETVWGVPDLAISPPDPRIAERKRQCGLPDRVILPDHPKWRLSVSDEHFAAYGTATTSHWHEIGEWRDGEWRDRDLTALLSNEDTWKRTRGQMRLQDLNREADSRYIALFEMGRKKKDEEDYLARVLQEEQECKEATEGDQRGGDVTSWTVS